MTHFTKNAGFKETEMSIPVALQLYSVRDDLKSDFAGTITKIAEMGYDGVELSDTCGLKAVEVKKILYNSGLVPISAHVPPAELFDNVEKTIEYYLTVGCEYIAFPWMPEEMRSTLEVFAETVGKIRRTGEYASAHGLSLLYHNHDFEFQKFEGKYLLDILYSEIPPEYLKTEIDVCWAKFAGIDPADYIRKYAGRSPVVHLKDYVSSGNSGTPYELLGKEEIEKKKNDGFMFKPLGKGVQDIPSVLAAAVDAGSEWVVVEQDFSPECPALESVKMSREYLRRLGI